MSRYRFKGSSKLAELNARIMADRNKARKDREAADKAPWTWARCKWCGREHLRVKRP